MKIFIIAIISALSVNIALLGQQKQVNSLWTVKSPFEQSLFIENNQGQFDGKVVGSNEKIYFSTQVNGIDVYITAGGIVYRYDKLPKIKDEDTYKKGKENIKGVTELFSLEWKGSNSAVQVIPEEESTSYYCYPKGHNNTIVAHAYKKILLKNLYPNIDVEYSFPDGKKGVEYSVILHPGADISRVRLVYPDARNMKLSPAGDIEMQSSFGKFIDCAPANCMQVSASAERSVVNCSFSVKNGEITFNAGNYDKTQTLIIDPWIINPVLTNCDGAYDLCYDLSGNVYVYGGYHPFKLVKINSSGTILWTYNAVFSGFSLNNYGDFTVDERTQTSYIGEGYDYPPTILKVSPAGMLVDTIALYISNTNTEMEEVWRMAYNYCNNKIVLAGGGPDTCQAAILDTTFSTFTLANVVHDTFFTHDMALLTIDNNGQYCYMATLKSVESNEIPFYNNVVIKSPVSALRNPVYIKPDYCTFDERGCIAYVDSDFGNVNGMNGMISTRGKLYIYDGARVKLFNKNTGGLIDSVTVAPKPFHWGGIDADCESNIYIGKQDSLVVYDSTIARHAGYKLADTVYSVKVGNSGLLYACGLGFVSSIYGAVPQRKISITSVIPSSCSACDGRATANVACGTPPFSFNWSNGETTQTISSLCPGIYTVTVSDGDCTPELDTAIVNIPGELGFSATESIKEPGCTVPTGAIKALPSGGSPPYFYNWSNGETTQTATGLLPGTYQCTLTDNLGCKYYISVTLNPPLPPDIIVTPPVAYICPGSNVVLSASGASTYTWLPATGLSCTNCPSPTATPANSTTYTVTGIDSLGCSASNTIIVERDTPHIYLTAFPECNSTQIEVYSNNGIISCVWSPSADVACDTCQYTNAFVRTATTLTVTATDLYGCTATDTLTVYPPPDSLRVTAYAHPDSICVGDTAAISVIINKKVFYFQWGYPFGGWVNCDTCLKALFTDSVAGVTNIYAEAEDSSGCFVEIPLTITVSNQPTAGISAYPGEICIGQSTTLVAFGQGKYRWNTGQTTDSITVSPTSTETYSLTVNNGCVATSSATVIVRSTSSLNGVSVCCDATIMGGQTVQLNTTGAGPGVTYLWRPPTGLSCDTCPDPVASPNVSTTYTVTLSTDSGCSISDLVTIDVNCGDVFVPDAFSPNGDGHNDVLYVRALCVSSLYFSVYDRWGNKVFDTYDQNIGWDGKHDGLPMNMGTYVWYLKATLFDGGVINKRGNVTLVR